MSIQPIIDKQVQHFEHLVEQARTASRFRRAGMVVEISGLTIVARGPAAQIGELCALAPDNGDDPIYAQVVAFRENHTILLTLGSLQGVEPGCRVVAIGQQLQIGTGPQMLGRVVDCFGRPLDDKGPIPVQSHQALENAPPPPLKRRRITEPLWVGVRAIDGLLTCCQGQRLGIFSGAGVGKSMLLGMIARNSSADVNVIALVGERGREVLDFLERDLGEGLSKSVVVVTTSDQAPLLRVHTGLAATAIAEYFRDQGANVLLLMDSLTRLARAQREVGLAAGEMPTTGGYPPSLYTMLPGLLERAGATQQGTITGLYTVLVEQDDIYDPVGDAASAILDGRIVLSRHLAEAGHYPAIDTTQSVSRLMSDVVKPDHRQAAAQFRSLVAARNEARDLIDVGAYTRGSDPQVDRALALRTEMNRFLQQPPDEYTAPDRTRQWLKRLMTTR